MHNIVHRKPNLSHTTTDYVGNFVFEGGEFKRYNFDDGYIFPYWKPDTHTYCQGYNYYVKDHQGNIRMIVNNNGTVSQVNHLTAYGASMGNSYNQEFNKYKYNGKELDRMHGLDLYDYGARQYDPAIGSFTSMDPLAEKFYDVSPYVYCHANPVMRIDPDGNGDFWLKGTVIGNDGVDNNKIYVIKTTEKQFIGDNYKIPGAGLSKKDMNATVEFIKANSGDSEAFSQNDIAYKNSIEIVSSSDIRQGMVDVVTKGDDGRGGTKPDNNREYGGSIENGKVVPAPPGPVSILGVDTRAEISLPAGGSTFHSHPSGTIGDPSPISPGTIQFGPKETAKFDQHPSDIDIHVAGEHTHYVFGRGDNKVYIYNRNGVQAVIPMKYFVTPKIDK